MAKDRLIILVLLSTAICLGQETADDKAHEGNALYKKGDFAGALKQYEEAKKLQPNRLAIDFNMGDAYYRQKEYAKAADAHKIASGSENVLLSAESHYNIGNGRYREGETGKADKTPPGEKAPAQEEKADADRMAKWEQALNAYKSSIELLAREENSLDGNAGQALGNARANYEFVKQKLDQEKQNQQQDQQQNKSGGGGG
ncbi:MAG: tetratricopeptide repeat protein, partial [Planctomycetota bacterium]